MEFRTRRGLEGAATRAGHWRRIRMNDRFTQRVRKVLFLARDEAGRLQHDYIGTEHLLLGMIREGEGVAANVLRRMNIDFERIQKAVEDSVTAPMGPVSIGEIPFTPRAKKVLELSIDEARLHNHNYVGTEHLLLALIREGEGVAARRGRTGADHEGVKREVMKALGGDDGAGKLVAGRNRKKPLKKKENGILEQFGRNMTEMAKEGKLDPIIGREREIDRVLQILSRRKKNNPVLIGGPASARPPSSRVFATRIFEANGVPSCSGQARWSPWIWRASWPAPSTAASSRSASSRIMAEIRRPGGDPVHRRAAHHRRRGRGRGASTPPTCSSPPSVAASCSAWRYHLDEYREFIEKDGALERRFQPVMVNPPSEEETVEIVLGLARQYEAHDKEVPPTRPSRPRVSLEPFHLRARPARQGHRHHRRSRQRARLSHGRGTARPARHRKACRGSGTERNRRSRPRNSRRPQPSGTRKRNSSASSTS